MDEIEGIKKSINLNVMAETFRYCRENVGHKKDGGVTVEQRDVFVGLEKFQLPKNRRANPGSPLTPEEIFSFQSGIGAIGWLARQIRGDLSFAASKLAQGIARPTIADIAQLKKAVDWAKEDAGSGVVFLPDVKLDEAIIDRFYGRRIVRAQR